VRNLALVLIPAVALGLFALALQDRVDGRIAAGAIAVAIVPSPLVATGIVARLRGRMDLTGALCLGTIVLSLLVVGSRGALAAGALFVALEVFAIAAMVAGAIPPLRDLLLPVLRVVGWLAFAVVLESATVAGGSPFLEGAPLAPTSFILESAGVALGLLVIGVAISSAVAIATAREPLAAIAGAGLRDPALAVALATITSGPDATGVPLIYALFCLVLAGIARLAR
jgi:hypothetical protein